MKKYRKANLVINDYGNGRKEFILHKNLYSVLVSNEFDADIDRRRNFQRIGDLLIPIKENKNLDDLNGSILDSSKRALERFYGFVFANEWTYFGTFTCSDHLVNRYDRDSVIYSWQLFRQRFQNYDKNVKILAVTERHKDGAIHLHSLIQTKYPLPIVLYGDISLLPHRYSNSGKSYGFNTFTEKGTFTCLPKTNYTHYLMPYYEFGKIHKSSYGDDLFSYNKYAFGINSFAILPVEENSDKAANYLSKYLTKNPDSQYGEKRYFHTGNLKYKEKSVIFATDEEVFRLIAENKLMLFKSKEGYYVFRNFNIKENNSVCN